ncbi:efflux RND transporter periplasmic adaptor subunit [Agrobacterium sp. ES01]|uniref:efflux RND transporter periplasmic adaptor subunit n=1 Tax=Agrobacterium sp. ES01 TaxID=3420714 RepID=UPI003D0B5E40
MQTFTEHVLVEPVKMEADLVHASGTGEVKARVESVLSFKTSGRVLSRFVDVGDHVVAGQLLATLDPTEQKADVESARAAVASQEATLRRTSSVLTRRRALMQSGVISREDLDSAVQENQSAEQDLNSARAQLSTALNVLEQTELHADADGIITERDVETGQIVQASAAVYTLAQDGPRDAVFNVQESALSSNKKPISIDVALVSRPDVKAAATIREISPALDRSLGTVMVKLAITDPPPEMSLGTAISADVVLERAERISVPWQSLFSREGTPAVWVMDPKTNKVDMKPVKIERYDAANVVLADGLEAGELVVIDGGQFLRAGQPVSYIDEAAQ